MLLTAQFPLADCRFFLSGTGVLPRPSWPRPLVQQGQFVRSFGPTEIRPLGGLDSWIGESIICNAHRALQFEHLPRYVDATGQDQSLRLAFQRFYGDGLAVAKFELGCSTQPRTYSNVSSLDSLLESFLFNNNK